jgi:hypothetical protein
MRRSSAALDRRNFRKKILARAPASRRRRVARAHRPAALYAFRRRRPMMMESCSARGPASDRDGDRAGGSRHDVRTGVASAASFSVDYIVRISRRDPGGRAGGSWRGSTRSSFRLVFRDDRMADVSGTGSLAWHGRTLVWTPGGPYAHLRYTMTIPRPRPPGVHYESWAAGDWIATRALHLFPEINVNFREGTRDVGSRARLVFQLPRGWKSAAAQAPIAENAFVVEEPGKRFARPRGWFLLGRIARDVRRISGTDVTVASAPGSALDARRLLHLYRGTVPLLAVLLGSPPPRRLVVSAPDPMWHGGLSGEDSFFVNGHIPIRWRTRRAAICTSSSTSGSRSARDPTADDLRRSRGVLLARAPAPRRATVGPQLRARGVALRALRALGIDVSRTHQPAALNNTAPFLMYWLDQEIRAATAGARSLDDAVRHSPGRAIRSPPRASSGRQPDPTELQRTVRPPRLPRRAPGGPASCRREALTLGPLRCNLPPSCQAVYSSCRIAVRSSSTAARRPAPRAHGGRVGERARRALRAQGGVGRGGRTRNGRARERRHGAAVPDPGGAPERARANDYYAGFANQVMWPLCHMFPSRVRLQPTYWNAYRQANERFAAAATVAPGDLVWVHDFHPASCRVAARRRRAGADRRLLARPAPAVGVRHPPLAD